MNRSASTTAIKLFNLPNGDCAFQTGKLPDNIHFEASHFWLQKHTDEYETKPHPAPRVQYVITLKGRLQFSVTDGSGFMLEPGIILVAADTVGEGHSWELLEGDEWVRIYIPVPEGSNDHFMPDMATGR